MIDLHSHTTASDGTLAPAALVRRAALAGVRVLAVTDHDTVAGVSEAREAAGGTGGAPRIVPGIELSARWGRREVHVLGHFLDPASPALRAQLARFQDARRDRMVAMVERARSIGLPVTLEEVLEEGRGSLGRPHLARLLVKKGRAKDLQDAFDRWIGRSGPVWIERPMPSAAEAIRLVREAGGLATIAHPALSGLAAQDLEGLKAEGLAGVEVDHPGHAPEVRATLRATAARLGLAATAGSDFHAPSEDGDRLGTEGMDEAAFARYESRLG